MSTASRNGSVHPPAIEVHGLVKSFGEVEAVRGVEFEVATGEVFGFLGPQRRRQDDHDQHAVHAGQADRRLGQASPATTSSTSATTSGATSAWCSRTRRSTAT